MVLGRAGRARRAEWLFEVVAVFRASGWHILLRDTLAGAGLRSKGYEGLWYGVLREIPQLALAFQMGGICKI